MTRDRFDDLMRRRALVVEAWRKTVVAALDAGAAPGEVYTPGVVLAADGTLRAPVHAWDPDEARYRHVADLVCAPGAAAVSRTDVTTAADDPSDAGPVLPSEKPRRRSHP